MLAVYAWSLLSMLTTLAGTTLLSFRLQPTLTVLLTAAGAFGFIETTLAIAARYRPEVGRRIVAAAAALGAIGAMTFSQDIPDVLRPDIVVAYTDTDGYGQRADRRPPGAERYYREIDAKIQEATGKPRNETVVLTADYSFLSYYPYYGFQGLTSHYANPLAQFDKRGRRHRGLGDVDQRRGVHFRAGQAAVGAADCVLDAPRRQRHLHAAAGVRRLPQPAQRPPLPGRTGLRAVRRPPLRGIGHRPLRAGDPPTRTELMATEATPQTGQLPSSPVAAGTNHRTARIVAIVAGLLGAALALATPLLPVNQTTAQLNWPQNGVLQSVNAPLIGYVATDLNITVPCQTAAGLAGPENAGRTVLLSTVPKQAPKAVDRGLLIERVNNDLLVIVRNTPVVSAPLNQVLSPECQRLTFTAHADKVTGEFVGLVQGPDSDDPGEPLRGERSGYDFRPQIVGVFTDLAGPAPPGLEFSATIDSRYSTSPTLLKLLAMIVGVAMTLIALGALHVLDTSDGMRHRRFLPPRWWSVTPLDGLVTAVLVWWHFVGANTADDGYILTMARVSEHAGYMANYYRWFGTPEAPFGWYYDLLALWAQVSTNSAWMRLPTLVMALACWWLISREVIPRLGHAVKTSRAAAWTAAGIFLAFWLPLNNGLRPEPIIALGILLTWCSVERGVATNRMLPVAIAIIIGALTIFSGPTGIAAVGALLVAVGPLKTIVARHTSRFGYLALLAPILAACTVPIILIFRDQTLAGETAGQFVQGRRRPEPELVRRTHPLRAVVHGYPGRIGGTAVRGTGPTARAGRLGGNVVAQGPDSGHRRGPEPTDHRHHDHLVPGDDVHPHQVDPPFRGVRRAGRVAGCAGGGRGHGRRDALAAQPRGVRRRGVVRDGVVLRQRQRLVVCLQFRCAVVKRLPGVAVRLHHHAAGAFRASPCWWPRGSTSPAATSHRRARIPVGGHESCSRRWRLPPGFWSSSRCCR